MSGTSTTLELTGPSLGLPGGCQTIAKVELQGCKVISDEAYQELLDLQVEIAQARQELASCRASAFAIVEAAGSLHRISQQMRVTSGHLKPLMKAVSEYQKGLVRRMS